MPFLADPVDVLNDLDIVICLPATIQGLDEGNLFDCAAM